MENADHQPETSDQDVIAPPKSLIQTLAKLGPGMIIAGSIVGSGELIATTKVGAEAKFFLLWLIIIGCVIKVFAQVEFGRHTVTYGQTPLQALDSVPGPRLRCNWILWYWAVMTFLIVAQQGGIVGGVGQALSITVPLTQEGRDFNVASQRMIEQRVNLAMAINDPASTEDDIVRLQLTIEELEQTQISEPADPYIWAVIIAVLTSILLYIGRYDFIQMFSTVLVCGFTLVTIMTVVLLQFQPRWAITGQEFAGGLKFGFPPAVPGSNISPIATALAAFGIIGVGASELIMYPYWCLEKGYAKFTGRRDDSAAWGERARGWMRVLQFDVWSSMLVYTFATVAFYLLGAAVLGRIGMNPGGTEMVRTLAQMYVPVFGSWAPIIFLIGAIAVLYSTFFVAAAGHARMVADGCGVFKLHDGSEKTRMSWTRIVSVLWPIIAVSLYCFVKAPAQMILASGVAQSIMLPMLGFAAMYFRYKKADDRLRPGIVWDAFLWLSFAGLTIAGCWTAYAKLTGAS